MKKIIKITFLKNLTSHKNIGKVLFTGGTETGSHVIRNTAENFAQLTLELGGKSPVIVFADADVENALNNGFKNVNVSCDFMGIVSTPMVSFYTKLLKYDFGIMISASHNPYYDNGIKIFKKNGEKLNDREEVRIEKLLDSLHTKPNIRKKK